MSSIMVRTEPYRRLFLLLFPFGSSWPFPLKSQEQELGVFMISLGESQWGSEQLE